MELNHTLLNNQEITEEIKEKIKKYLETNYNENTMIQNLWDAAKAVLRGKFIPCLKKQEKSQINNLTLHLKELEKEEQTKPRVSRRKEFIKIRAEINEIETKKTIAKINKTKSWFFAIVSFISFSFISDLIFMISFLLLTLGFSCSFTNCFRCKVRLFI